MDRTNRKVAISYFVIHALVELVCFSMLCNHFPVQIAWTYALIFDTMAFMPQGIIGAFMEKHPKFEMGTLGVVLMLASLPAYNTENPYLLALGVTSLALGNACLHECGAIATVTCGQGRLFPSALFVAGGSFGVISGQLLGRSHVSVWYLAACLVVVEALVLLTNPAWKPRGLHNTEPATEPAPEPTTNPATIRITDPTTPTLAIILIAFTVTAVRSFIGYAIPTGWRKETWQAILLFGLMGAGKAFGGYAVDKWGARVTGLATTVLAIPFLVLGNRCMVVSIIGVFLFSMTMSITYGMLLSVLPQHSGIAFGVTTCGLYIGTLPVFLFGSVSYVTGLILIIVLSLLCYAGFYKTLKKRSTNKCVKNS